MSPAVSVVIATYNYGRFLAGALRSALAQTCTDVEVLVVDDGSTDDTPDVVRGFLQDPRVRYHRTAHQGQPRAKNTGIRLATAPLVAFLDADDLWLPHKLERQVERFAADPGLGVVYSRRLLMDEEGHDLEYPQPPLYRGNVVAEMFRDNFVCFSSAVVRREVFREAGLFDETIPLAIDYDLWLRAASRFRFDYVDEPLVRYRVGHANLSQRGEERRQIAMLIMRRFLKEYGGQALIGRLAVRRAWAETYCNLGLARRARSRLAALPWYLRAMAMAPWRGAVWKGLVSLALSEAGRRLLRRWLGRPEAGIPGKRLPRAEVS
jgi:glycosyltransferase involved in cell wall biosynthesis